MKKFILALFVLSLIVFASQLYFFLTENHQTFDIIYVLLAGFAALSMALAAKNADAAAEKKILKLFALGLLFWAIGDGLWMYYELILGIEVPYPSLADLFWLAGNVPILMAFFRHKKGLFITGRRKSYFHVLSAAFLAVSVYVLYIGLTDATIIETLINALYIIFDYLIIYNYLFVVASAEYGKLLKPWVILGFGFFVFGLFDIGFTWLTATDIYHTGNPIDLLYGLGYVLVAYAAFKLSRLEKLQLSQ